MMGSLEVNWAPVLQSTALFLSRTCWWTNRMARSPIWLLEMHRTRLVSTMCLPPPAAARTRPTSRHGGKFLIGFHNDVCPPAAILTRERCKWASLWTCLAPQKPSSLDNRSRTMGTGNVSIVWPSSPSYALVRGGSKVKARSVPRILSGRARQAWHHRWSSMLASASAHAFTLSLLDGRLSFDFQRACEMIKLPHILRVAVHVFLHSEALVVLYEQNLVRSCPILLTARNHRTPVAMFVLPVVTSLCLEESHQMWC